jgi:hypothetical protein
MSGGNIRVKQYGSTLEYATEYATRQRLDLSCILAKAFFMVPAAAWPIETGA